MRTKDAVVLAILAWLMFRRTNSSVNISITEPGFEGETVNEEFSY